MSIAPISRVDLPNIDGDVFNNKAAPWNYAVPRPSVSNTVQELQGRFAVVPVDAQVMDFLEGQVDKDLPVAHLYDYALRDLVQSDLPPEITQILQHDLQEREYFMARKLACVPL